MRKTFVLLFATLLCVSSFAQKGKTMKEIRMQQGGFCYLYAPPLLTDTNPPMPMEIKIHAVTAGTANKLGKMRADMWQTMTFDMLGNVTVSEGRFVFNYLDLPDGPNTISGTYSGDGPPLDSNGASTVSAKLVVTGGTGSFAGVNGNGIVNGTALMPAMPGQWTMPYATWDFILVPPDAAPLTPACAFAGDARLELTLP